MHSVTDPAQTERLETELHHHLMGEADAREGVTAFLERREPEWTLTVNGNWPDDWPGSDHGGA
jgi:hypothetical protein